MKSETQERNKTALSVVPFRPLAHRALCLPVVIPARSRADVSAIAPALHGAELERVRRHQELEMREKERELQRMRRMQEPVHRSD